MKRKKKVYPIIMALCLSAATPAALTACGTPEMTQPQETLSSAGPETVPSGNVRDLTALQWSSSDGSEYHIAGGGNASIHVPGFGTSDSNMEGDPVVVAVIDSAIDFTNPDLAPAAYTFTPEQQKKLGCDEHGFNATIESKDGILQNPDHESHGTHCAGIIGAAWDQKGISGVASNVRLISVQNYAEDGLTSMSNAMRAFEFIDRANEAGCGISLINCSWTMLQANDNLDAWVRYLGEKWGIVTVFAAGNEEVDLSTGYAETGALYQNPYAIIVGATDCAGELAPYSSYSKQITDLAGPGSGILSTTVTDPSQCEYFADAVPESNKLYEGFEDAKQKVTAKLTVNTKKQLKAVGTGKVTDDSHFSGTHSLKVSLDPKYAVESEDSAYTYWITLDLGDLSDRNLSPGDYLGLTFGGKNAFAVSSLDYWNPVKKEYEELIPECDTYSFSNGWVNCYVQLPELADLKHVAFSVNVIAEEKTDAIYLDAVGIGTEKVPYGMISGTSMAAPAVTGFAAVMKAAHPELSGKELADLVKSSVRPTRTLRNSLKSGGMLDFQASDSPVIDKLDISGKTVTLTGSHFGKSGKVSLRRYIAEKKMPKLEADIKEWTDDRVVLSLKSGFEGILQAELRNKKGGITTAVQFAGKGKQTYEEDLTIDQDPGELFALDAPGDYETTGPLMSMGDRLYYLPAITKVEMMPAHKTLRCYDIPTGTWSDLPDLPEWLSRVSAAVSDGRIYVKGTAMKLVAEDTAAELPDGESRIYVFDPETESWSSLSAKGVLNTDTLAGDDEGLILVGSDFSEPQEDAEAKGDSEAGSETQADEDAADEAQAEGDSGSGDETQADEEAADEAQPSEDTADETQTDEDAADEAQAELLPATVRRYDPDKGAGATLCKLKEELVWPAVAVKDGVICTYDPYTGSIERIRDGKSEFLEAVLEDILPAAADYETENYWLDKRAGVLLPVNDGFLLVGPAATDGSGDSFLLRDGETVFTPFEKRISDAKVFYPAAAFANGKIYAIGSSIFEPDCKIFRAAKLPS